MMRKIRIYIVGILIPLAVGGLAAFLTRNNMMLYDEITKPPLAPPAILFPIVWIVLYILMGIGSARVYISHLSGEETGAALKVYAIQLFFNFFWSIIFFNMRMFFFAFWWILILWWFVLLMVSNFLRVDFLAGILNVPYLLWVTFASYLNFAVYILN